MATGALLAKKCLMQALGTRRFLRIIVSEAVAEQMRHATVLAVPVCPLQPSKAKANGADFSVVKAAGNFYGEASGKYNEHQSEKCFEKDGISSSTESKSTTRRE